MASRIFTVRTSSHFSALDFCRFLLSPFTTGATVWPFRFSSLRADGRARRLAGAFAEPKNGFGSVSRSHRDKLLLSSSFVVLAMNRQISWWLATIVLSRDILILMTAAVILVVVGYRPGSRRAFTASSRRRCKSRCICRGAFGRDTMPWLHQLRNGIVFSSRRLLFSRGSLLLQHRAAIERASRVVAQAQGACATKNLLRQNRVQK